MAIRSPSSSSQTTTAKPDPAAQRRRVKLSGKDSLVDVAVRVFKDDRLVPLLMDLNPGVPGKGAVPSGTIVTVPGRDEAQRFAAKMGFNLGFDPAKGGSTKARKDWKKLQNGAQRREQVVDPTTLARTLLAQGHDAVDCAKRLAALVKEPELEAFIAAAHDDAEVAKVASAVEMARLRMQARAVLVGLVDVLEGTTRPKGRRRLLEVAVEKPAELGEVLDGFLVVPALKQDLLKKAAHAVSLLKSAEELARLDRHLQDAKLSQPGDDNATLRLLVDAATNDLELVDGERVQGLGVKAQLDALDKHTAQLATMLKKLTESVERAPREVLRAVVEAKSGSALPKPWPVVIALHGRVKERLVRVHAGRRADGIAALVSSGNVADVKVGANGLEVPHPASVAGPTMSAAELASHAARNARVADDHDGVPERLAPTLIRLFDPLRPSPPDSGPEAQVRQRRKSRFEKAVLSPKGSAGNGAAIKALTSELLELAKTADDPVLSRRAMRLGPAVKSGCLVLADGATGPVPALLREASDVARALFVVALALDPEIGPTLASAAGREAALQLMRRHATRVVTLATQAYVTAGSA